VLVFTEVRVRYFRIVRDRTANDLRLSIETCSCGTAPITTAIFLALASMFGFGAGFVLTQFGLRWMLPWLGVAISIPTSTLLFWCLAPFFVDPSGGSLKAVALFACVGLFFPGAAALLNFESNRLMGPNIAGALSSMTPVLAVLLAIVMLGERIRAPQLLALAAIVVGIGLCTASTSTCPAPRFG
jgi:drug/metabolite transporter (DMT)-like permease